MARFPLVPTAPEPERAILVGVEWRDNAWPLDRSLVSAFGKAVS